MLISFVLGFLRAFTFRPVTGFAYVPSPVGRTIPPPLDTFTHTLQIEEASDDADAQDALRAHVYGSPLDREMPRPNVEYEPSLNSGRRYEWMIYTDDAGARQCLRDTAGWLAPYKATCRVYTNLACRRLDRLQTMSRVRALPLHLRLYLRVQHALACARGEGPADGYFDPPV